MPNLECTQMPWIVDWTSDCLAFALFSLQRYVLSLYSWARKQIIEKVQLRPSLILDVEENSIQKAILCCYFQSFPQTRIAKSLQAQILVQLHVILLPKQMHVYLVWQPAGVARGTRELGGCCSVDCHVRRSIFCFQAIHRLVSLSQSDSRAE